MNMTTKEMEAARKLREYLNFEDDEELLQNDFKHNYLTINEGRDGKMYVWYLDESKNAAIEIESFSIISDEEELDELFG